MTNIFDSHVHSDNSSDGQHSVTFLCEQAVKLGIRGLCVTDHCDLLGYEKEQYERRIQQSVFDATMARNNFGDRLTILVGIELGDILFDKALTDKIIAAFPFDQILVSQHNQSDGVDFFDMDFKEISSEDLDRRLQEYFSYLVRVSEGNCYDSLTHLTYPLRYITGRDQIPVNLTRYDDWIEQIFRNIAVAGKALELNTSELGKALFDTMPPARYIRRFRELGGEYITLGSDAHCAEALGSGLEEGKKILVAAGFEKYTVYKMRQPLQFPIEAPGGDLQ